MKSIVISDPTFSYIESSFAIAVQEVSESQAVDFSVTLKAESLGVAFQSNGTSVASIKIPVTVLDSLIASNNTVRITHAVFTSGDLFKSRQYENGSSSVVLATSVAGMQLSNLSEPIRIMFKLNQVHHV